jgi:hypothetical protein
MLCFTGVLPKLTDVIFSQDLSDYLDPEIVDFFWKIKISNPNLLFVLSKGPKNSSSFKFYVGDNNRYLKDANLFAQFLIAISDYEVDKITCELEERDYPIDSYDIYKHNLLSFFKDDNVIFIECPPCPNTNYAILGQLLGELSKDDRFNMALVASGHLSTGVDKTKVFYDRQAKEIDENFIQQLKVDLFSIFNMNPYVAKVTGYNLQGQEIVSSSTNQNLYEQILVISSALSTVKKSAPVGDILFSSTLGGVSQLLAVFHSESAIQTILDSNYTIEGYLFLLLESRLLGISLDINKVNLSIPKDFSKQGLFLNLIIDGESRSCFGDPNISISKDNLKQTLNIFITNLIANAFKKIRIKDLENLQIESKFSDKGFSVFKIANIKDLLNYDLVGFKTKKGEKFFFLKDKSFRNLVKMLSYIDKDEVKAFGLK